MKQLSNKEIEENIRVLYEAGGTPLVFDWVREYNESNRGSRIALEECKACDMSSPSIEHTCLICGQSTN